MALIVIPARLQSSRLEKKMLALIEGFPLLWWTWQRALQSKLASDVFIATDSQEIFDFMTKLEAKCIMTSESCQSGSDRINEAVNHISSHSQEFGSNIDDSVIVNLQGDEPLMSLEILDGTITLLQQNPHCDIATAAVRFDDKQDFESPNFVKVVFNQQKRALYFSRACLAESWLHIGLYAYRKQALQKFCSSQPSSLEKAERLEQLRALENDQSIYVYQSSNRSSEHFGVDTEEDLNRLRKIILAGKSV